MIKFTVQPAGQTLINEAIAGIAPVIIDGVIIYVGDTAHKTLSLLAGSVYKDDSGIGEYCKISVEDLATDSSYTATSIGLKSGSVVVAKSEPISIVKATNKGLKLEISCQFTGASKCSFATIAIALPYATNFREGVIRIARDSDETQKTNTVYSAQKIDDIVEEIISGGVDLSGYVNWDKVGTTVYHGNVTVKQIRIVDSISSPSDIVTMTLDVNGKLDIDGLITGNAVSSTPTISSGAIVGSDKLVNETYISNLYASEITEANADKLVTSSAVTNYIQNQIGSDLVHKTGAETITGVKTFNANIVTGNGAIITGSAVQSDYDDGQDPPTVIWNNSANYSKLPTVEVVNSAIIAGDNTVRTEFATADNNLQSQIDALNAGQNLVDIVDLIGDLKGHSLTDLKSKNDYKHGSSGAVWPIGDKIQVLHDQTNSAGVIVPSIDGVATVYELVKGTPSGAKDQISTVDNNYYWRYIGQYGCDSYTKAESDDKYVIKANLDQTITSSSVNNNAPSSLAVYNAIEDAKTTIDGAYVKLISSTQQSINSSLLIYKANPNARVIIDGGHISFERADSSSLYIGGRYSCVDFSQTFAKIKIQSSSSDSNYSNEFITFGALSISSQTPDIHGNGVASYRSISGATLQDGRLVTVDYLNGITGNLSDYARLSQSNTFASNTTNTFGTVSATSYTGTGVYSSYSSSSWSTATTQIPTVAAVKSAMQDSIVNTISTVNTVGSIGLFIYSEIGLTDLDIGTQINGAYLKPAGISLPMSGQISYKSSSTAMSGTWVLLSLAVRRTATEPCLVLAQKVNDTYNP